MTITSVPGVPRPTGHVDAAGKPTPPDYTTPRAFTAATNDLLTSAAHGLQPGWRILVITSSATGLAAASEVFVISDGLTTDAFKVAADPAGTAVDVTGSGSGTWSLSTDAIAEIAAFVAAQDGSGVSVRPATRPEAIAKINEYIAYYATTDYQTWWAADQQVCRVEINLQTAARSVAGATLVNTEGTATTGAATLVIARPTRRQVLVRNLSSTVTIKVGPSGNVIFPILPGESLPFNTVQLLQVKTDSSTAAWAAGDEFD